MKKPTAPALIRIAATLTPALIAKIDAERQDRCSRASIVRMALVDRYKRKR